MKIKDLYYKNIAILGYGIEGKSTELFLKKLGVKKLTILDKSISKNYLDNLGDFDVIIKSPGISPYNEKIKPYIGKITSQTQIFFDNYDGKIISVTATKGKSTTSSLIYETLKNAGLNVKLVGNIGKPVLSSPLAPLLTGEGDKKYDYVVYELSSYMLENFIPKSYISILGNIFPDHIPWHENFENYKNAKLNIIKNSDFSLIGYTIYPKIEKNLLKDNIFTFGGRTSIYSHKENYFYIKSKKIENNIEIKLAGSHNLDNMCSVLGVCDILKIDLKHFFETIKNFEPLEYRLNNIGTYSGITFIDDSLSTTPESTIEAIKAYDQKIGTIFLGGEDRGYNFDKLIKIIKRYKIKNIVLFPDNQKKIIDSIINSDIPLADLNILETSIMKEAIMFAYKNTGEGEICLLSTASPSYSIWKNHKEKSQDFKREVEGF